MPNTSPIPVGVRLPLPTNAITPVEQVALCQHALDLGFSSFWVGDHVALPTSTTSTYPHSANGSPGFRADTPWTDPFLHLTWLAAQLPDARFGTSVLILTLRNPTLVAKQLATMSWLTRQPLSIGVGTGWLREEYDALGMTFEHRGSQARRDIELIRRLHSTGEADYPVRGEGDDIVSTTFTMLPKPPAPVNILWGGISPLAMRIIASSCDGWLPAKQSVEALESHVGVLRTVCEDIGRDFSDLRIVVKPGPGPDPSSGAIDRDGLCAYAELGCHEAVLEMPYETDSLATAKTTLDRVASRTWG